MTDSIKSDLPWVDRLYYISDDSAMINDVTDYLAKGNISLGNIHPEIYF
ncbi:MAG: hypothetical protein GY834_01895 [Bacteroidetes bacterium]|nr:hypothetical protein [Bacteroidota bacterium]